MSTYTQTSGSNELNTITIQANSYRRILLDWLTFSYSAAPTSGGRVYVNNGDSTIWDTDVIAGGSGPIYFDPPLPSSVSSGMTINVAASGGAATSRLSVSYRFG